MCWLLIPNKLFILIYKKCLSTVKTYRKNISLPYRILLTFTSLLLNSNSLKSLCLMEKTRFLKRRIIMILNDKEIFWFFFLLYFLCYFSFCFIGWKSTNLKIWTFKDLKRVLISRHLKTQYFFPFLLHSEFVSLEMEFLITSFSRLSKEHF